MTADEDAYREWRDEERQRLLSAFADARPPVFAAPGQLDPRVHAWLERFVRGQARTLIIGGRTGAGKTWSCWKAVETLLWNGWRGTWRIVSAYELLRVTMPPVDGPTLDRLARADLLVIDDLGSMRVTDWASSHIHGLVDYRWSHQLPMIITTNVPDIGALVGDRIASRLADGMESIALTGPDLRRETR